MVLGIYGAGGLGKEIFDSVILSTFNEFDEIVFIDDNDRIHDFYGKQVFSFVGFQNNYNPGDCKVMIGVGEPSIRAHLYEKVVIYGYSFASITHVTSIISTTCKIGNGVYIGPFSFISSDTVISDNVVIQPHAMIGHDASIGHSSVISTNAVLAGNCSVGARSFIAMNVSVEQKIRIGDDTIIGMASCVNKDIPSNVVAMGYPARVLKMNDAKQVF